MTKTTTEGEAMEQGKSLLIRGLELDVLHALSVQAAQAHMRREAYVRALLTRHVGGAETGIETEGERQARALQTTINGLLDLMTGAYHWEPGAALAVLRAQAQECGQQWVAQRRLSHDLVALLSTVTPEAAEAIEGMARG